MIALALLLLASPPEARTLSLEECVRLALEKNAEVLAADAGVDEAKAARASMSGNFGPRLRLDGTYLYWTDEYALPFAPPPAPPLVVREQVTTSMGATVVQPITPLVAVYAGFRATDLGVDAARVQRDRVRRDTAFQATEAYFRLLQAKELAGVAATSVKQVEAALERTKAFEKQGVLARNDVLRVEIALAGAKQRAIQAEGAVALASARVALVLGLPQGIAITPSAPPAAPASLPAQTADDTVERALEDRAELRELDLRIRQARALRGGSWTKLAPQVNAIANWQRISGSAFQQEEASYVGLSLTWDAWDWGSSYFATRQASAAIRRVQATRALAANGIALEARAAHITYTTALEAMRVAQASVAQAEENFRIESRKYEQNAATTFDVLDAESLLTQARSQWQTALYDSHVAAANLERALGRTPGTGEPK